MHKIVRLHLVQNIIPIGACAFGFSKATVPGFSHAIASGFITLVGQRYHRLLLKVLQATASA
jgi:hypothetical protein